MGRVSIKVQRRYKPAASRNLVLPAALCPALAQAVLRGCGVSFSHFEKTVPEETDKPYHIEPQRHSSELQTNHHNHQNEPRQNQQQYHMPVIPRGDSNMHSTLVGFLRYC